MLARCEARFHEEWEPLWRRADELSRHAVRDRALHRAMKGFTETVVTPEFLAAPNWRRCHEKPLGYPGDYLVMDSLYEARREGATSFARLVHEAGQRQPIAACVKPRMHVLRDAIAEVVASGTRGEGPVNVTSLGCGPAREVEEYLRARTPERAVHFDLIDQDDRALSFAYRRVYREMVRHGDRVAAQCLYVSFSQLLASPDAFEHLAPQDLVYSAGLFDYIRTARAQTLVEALYAKLRPGGLLVIGNMKAPTDAMWAIEFVLDWSLIYRTADEMRALAARVPTASVEVRTDPTGYAYLLYVRKP